MNSRMIEPYTIEEIRMALFQMHLDKAPGVDGFPASFYQKFWSVIKDDVCEEILNFLNNDQLDINLNKTQMILLQKKDESLRVEDFSANKLM